MAAGENQSRSAHSERHRHLAAVLSAPKGSSWCSSSFNTCLVAGFLRIKGRTNSSTTPCTASHVDREEFSDRLVGTSRILTGNFSMQRHTPGGRVSDQFHWRRHNLSPSGQSARGGLGNCPGHRPHRTGVLDEACRKLPALTQRSGPWRHPWLPRVTRMMPISVSEQSPELSDLQSLSIAFDINIEGPRKRALSVLIGERYAALILRAAWCNWARAKVEMNAWLNGPLSIGLRCPHSHLR